MLSEQQKKEISEEFTMKINETIAYAVGGTCGDRTVEDCKIEIKSFIFSTIDKIIEQKVEEVSNLMAIDMPEEIENKLGIISRNAVYIAGQLNMLLRIEEILIN